MDEFERQISWVESLDGDDRAKAGSVVAWQGISTTLNELVSRFNDIKLAPAPNKKQRNREVHLKKLIVGMLFELDSCLDYWARLLREDGLLTNDINDKKKAFKTEMKKVGLDKLKSIRNGIAFHCTDYLSEPDALIETYRTVDSMSIDALRRIHTAAIDCGFAMRDSVMNTISN
jgi:hypothetical protein